MGTRTPKGPWQVLALPQGTFPLLTPSRHAGWVAAESLSEVGPSIRLVWPEGLRDLAVGRGFQSHCEGEINLVD